MKRVVLIYPQLPERLPALSFPTPLLYIGSYLVSKGINVTILDANNFKDSKTFFNTLRGELDSALVVGLSVMTAQVPSALDISQYIKQLASSVPIVWGGVHPSLFAKQTAKCSYIDFVVRGEGELTMLELLKALDGQMEIEKVKGIAFIKDGGVVITSDRELMDVNRLPPLRWELLENIKPGAKLRLNEVAKLTGCGVYLQTSRGCPHRCAFCINSVLKLRYRERRSDLVLNDIEELINFGVNKIWFTDETFFANKKRVIEILEGIEAKKLKFKWFANIRADYFNPNNVSPELALRLKESGCEILGIGAESGSQRILNRLKKDITVEDTLNAAQLLNKVGIKATFSFMIGLPGEDRTDILKTLRLIEAITKIDTSFTFQILGPQVYRPYPGSELYFECIRQGMKEPATTKEWALSPYIRSETNVNPNFYPWIKHPGDFINMVCFYGGLSGIRLRYPFITKALRKIASLRCKRLYFKYPIEKVVYNLFMKTGLYRLLRIKDQLEAKP